MHEGSRDSTASVELPSNMLFDCNLSVGCSPLLVLGKGSKKKSEKVLSFAKPSSDTPPLNWSFFQTKNWPLFFFRSQTLIGLNKFFTWSHLKIYSFYYFIVLWYWPFSPQDLEFGPEAPTAVFWSRYLSQVWVKSHLSESNLSKKDLKKRVFATYPVFQQKCVFDPLPHGGEE